MPACVHGNVCRAWMNERMIVNKRPLSIQCPYGCAYFEELDTGKDFNVQVNQNSNDQVIQISTLDDIRLMRQKAIHHVRESIDTWHITKDELEGSVNPEK